MQTSTNLILGFPALILGKGKVSLGRVVGMYFDKDGDGEGRFMGRYSLGCKETADEGSKESLHAASVPAARS